MLFRVTVELCYSSKVCPTNHSIYRKKKGKGQQQQYSKDGSSYSSEIMLTVFPLTVLTIIVLTFVFQTNHICYHLHNKHPGQRQKKKKGFSREMEPVNKKERGREEKTDLF